MKQSDIFKFEYRGGWDVRWDDKVPGLGVRLYASGKRAFVLSYRSNGRKRLMVIGRCGADLTLNQARDIAMRNRVDVRDGKDPLEQRRRQAQAATFSDLVDTYLAEHAQQHKKTWETDKSRLERHIPPPWRSRKVNQISRNDIARLHRDIGRTRPYEANRTIDLLRVMFRLAKLWSFLDQGAENPVEGIKKYAEVKRKRWIHPDELPNLANAIDTEPSIYVRSAIWLYLLTAARKRELLNGRWDDVDWQRSMLRLRETKSGDEQDLPLSSPALEILRAIPKLDGNPYIFPGRTLGQPLVNIDKPWRRIRRAARLDDLRLHDLRRTVGSWMSQMGVELNTVREALRHESISTTLTYARLGADPARQAIERHGRRLVEASGRESLAHAIRGKQAEN